MANILQFRVSSALKDIIGRDLITDDFIAVFELVKNSFDAYANTVNIHFNNIYSANGQIIIEDDGKGMNYDDLTNKWLFVAYSAKQEGTEDENYDYRDSIYTNRAFAGAKGIGRFSCDKLGKSLYLETTKQEANSKTEILITDWKKFEEDIKDEFIDIPVEHETKASTNKFGTRLTISDLRSSWDRDKLLKLKDSLAKLINPNNRTNEEKFQIILHVPDEVENDSRISNSNEDVFEYRKVVNGPVVNFIFDELRLKTTKIHAEITEDGEYIITSLFDGGTMIYKIKEKNKYALLRSINFTLYYLNRAAKMTFAKRMGLASRRFGHVFLYKNGFRIYPFGEPFEDPLKIDVRKSRKQYSTLGTGELMGQIDVSGINPGFKETSSRGDGLIKTPSYHQLEEVFYIILERLEKYVIDVQKWGLSIEDKENKDNIGARVADLINYITGSNEIIDFEYAENFLEIVATSQAESMQMLVANLNRIAKENNNGELFDVAKHISARLDDLQKARISAERLAEEERIKASTASKQLEETVSENLFLKSIKSQDFEEIVSFVHHIGISAGIVDNYLNGIYKRINRNEVISPQDLREIIQDISFENRKIMSISKFATKANFILFTEEKGIDLVNYIQEYITNVLKSVHRQSIDIRFVKNNINSFFINTRPIEINILIDNFLSNSKKADATFFEVELKLETENRLRIIFRDDGVGILPENIPKIFDFGYTTTSGSGLGLYHAKLIAERIGGRLEIKPDNKQGTEISLTLNKN